MISQIAAERAAGLIAIRAEGHGMPRRALEGRLAEELGGETPVRILLAPP